MVTLLRRKKKEDTAKADVRDVEQDVLRLLLLVPAEGGFSFRLYPFPTIEALAAYLERHFPRRTDRLVVFRALHERPSDAFAENGDPVEAVVLVRDPDRGGFVHLYSFVDMEMANAFIRTEGGRGLGLHHVLVYWAQPVELPSAEAAAADAPPPASIPAPLQQWQARPETPRVHVARTEVRRTTPPPPPPVSPEAQAPAPIAPVADPEPAPLPVKTPRRGTVHMAPLASAAAPRPAAGFVGRDPSPDATAAKAEKAQKPAKAPKVKAESSTEPTKSQLSDLWRRISSWGGWDGLAPQMWTAAIARWQTFEEVRKDEYATGRAWLIVGASVFFAALGGGINGGPASFFFYGICAAIGAAMYLGALYVIATLGFGGKLERNGGTLFLQRLGLSASPGVLLLLSVIPTFGPIFVLVSFIWIGFASVKPIELSLQLDNQSAGYSVIFAWFALFGFGGVLPLLIG